MITAYTLTFAGLLLDRWPRSPTASGRRTALLGGLGRVRRRRPPWPGSPRSFEVLVAGRALQGAFAAVHRADGAVVDRDDVHRPARARPARSRCTARWRAAAPSSGCVVGGALTELASWRWCLLVNVLFALGALVAGSAAAAAHASQPRRRRCPSPRAALATAGLAALVYGRLAGRRPWLDRHPRLGPGRRRRGRARAGFTRPAGAERRADAAALAASATVAASCSYARDHQRAWSRRSGCP